MPEPRKVEIPCPACGQTHQVEEERLPDSGELPCPECGGTIAFAAPASAPAAAPAAAPAPAPRRPAHVDDWEDEDTQSDEVACPACGHRFDPDRARAGRATVLVVEDKEVFLGLATDALGRRYNAVPARSVAEARQVLATRPIDLVLLDLSLPDGDGVDVLRALPRQDIPVLLYTNGDEGSLMGEEWDRLRALGVHDVVQKGLNIDDVLLAKAANLLGASAPAGH
ncbi:MAG: response regulator [Acidobacteria bacterium]|nr:MAG: response regulator [Acidobacteriota bacterium]